MKKTIFTTTLLCTLACHAASDPMQALFDEWKKAPGSHPNLPDCSHAGYQAGNVPPPEVPVVTRVTDFGATPNDDSDDTAAIRKAVDAAAAKGGGAVLLPAGVWRISAPIFLLDNNVVLRGEGSVKTILQATRPLNGGVGVNISNGKSRWSWSGGMVWIAPREVRGDLTGEPAERSASYQEGWRPGAELAKPGNAKRGDTKIPLAAGATALKAGTLVLLALEDPGDSSLWRHLAGDIAGAAEYDWKTKGADLFANQPILWPVEIAAADATGITLRQPLRFDLRAEWKPRLLASGPLVRGCGVEQLAVRMEPAKLSAHLENPGWNGIYFENAIDCWATGVLVKDVDNGIGTAASKRITLDRFTVTGRAAHHATFCRVSSHDILWTRFSIDCKSVHHGLNVEGLSTGNVWSAGTMAHGTLDSHRALPFENIRTDLRIHNDGAYGGGNSAGPLFGARFAHWNIEVTNERPHMVNVPNMIPRGVVVAVRGAPVEPKPDSDFTGDLSTINLPTPATLTIPDLHLAQLAARLGKPPLHLGGPIQPVVHRTDGTSLRIEWADSQTAPQTYRISRKDMEPVVIQPPARAFEDRKIVPGGKYTYQIQPTLPGRESAGVEIEVVNLPAPIRDLASDAPGLGPVATLRWQPTAERGGEIVVSRRPQGTKESENKPLATLPISTVEYSDRTAGPAATWTYSLAVRNVSGISKALETDTYTRAAGTTLSVETFQSATEAKLPAKGALGTWNWKGTSRDRVPHMKPGGSQLDPASADGELAWGVIGDGTQSFIWTDGVSGDFSRVGAEFGCDFYVGNSAVNTHILAPCLRLADGSWIVGNGTYTGPTKGWRKWADPLKPDTKWAKLDPETLAIGPTVASPDVKACTAIGVRIDRPINNRTLQLDNIRVHAIRAKR